MPVPRNNSRMMRAGLDYFDEKVPAKKAICLHYTAGSTAAGAIEWWRQKPENVGTAFVVDRDGTVYQAHPTDCWAWHLGIGRKEEDSTTIGIEIANVGWLQRGAGGKLYTENWTLYGGAWVERPKWRDKTLWAAYPQEQMLAVGELVRDLCLEYNIPHVIPPKEWRDEFDLQRAIQWNGILSHQNYRKDKFDVGPAFQWEYVAI